LLFVTEFIPLVQRVPQ